MKKKTLLRELVVGILAALSYIVSILADLSVIPLPDFLILTYKSQDDLLLTLFSVQAGVSTIGIAVVSIITGVTNETIYGVSITKYITSIKPRIFKHTTLLIISLFLIILNYGFVSFNLFNCSIASLVVSVVISVVLVKHIAVIFKGKEYVRKEILQYIKESYNEEIISDLNSETIDAIEGGSSYILKRNYEAYKAIIKKEIGEAVNREDPVDDSPITAQLSKSISDVFEKIAKTRDANKINDAIIFVCDVYDIANKRPNYPHYLQIWNYISRTYYNSLKHLSYDHLREDGACWSLRNKLYKNVTNRTKKQLKACDLGMYSSWICYALCSQTEKFSSEEIKHIVRRTYDNAYYTATRADSIRAISDVYVKEICRLHKYFIDEFDEESINDLYFRGISDVSHKDNSRTIYLVTIIYLYYLSMREPMLNGKKIQTQARNILHKNRASIEFFFYRINLHDAIGESYAFIQSLMRFWEHTNDGEMKQLVIDDVILDFFVFAALSETWREDELIEVLDSIIPDGMFSAYSRYFSDNQFEELKANYRKFYELFAETLDAESLTEKMILLKSVFDKKYKEEEIRQAQNNPITDDMLLNFKENCLQMANSYTSSHFSVFAIKNRSASGGAPSPIHRIKNVTILSTVVSSLSLSKEDFASYYGDAICHNMGACFLNTILPSIRHKKCSYKSRDKQQFLVDAILDNGINADIVIGDKNKRWNEANKTLLLDSISTASELRFPHMNNQYFILESQLIEFSIDGFKVEFSDVELDELADNFRRDESGRIEYNITNQLFVPFEESELREHLHNIKRKVTIKANIKYRISKECVGAGISITVD